VAAPVRWKRQKGQWAQLCGAKRADHRFTGTGRGTVNGGIRNERTGLRRIGNGEFEFGGIEIGGIEIGLEELNLEEL